MGTPASTLNSKTGISMGNQPSTQKNQNNAIEQQKQSPNKFSTDQKQLNTKTLTSPNKRKKVQINYLMGILQKIPNDYSKKNSEDAKLSSFKKQFKEQVQTQLRNIYQTLIEDTIKLANQNELTIKQCKVKICQAIIYIHIEMTKCVQKNAKMEDARAFCKEIKQFLKKVCTYLKSKYPRSQTVRSWQMWKQMKQFDYTEEYQYDMLRRAGIYFGEQEQYDITKNIKQFFNKILDQYKQNYKKFTDIVENKVFNISLRNTPEIKIGRKLDQNTQKYSRLDTGIVQVRTSEISRVLVKWMQDLSQMLKEPENKIKATNEYYFYNQSKPYPFPKCSSSTWDQLIKKIFRSKTVKEQNEKCKDKQAKLQEVFNDFNLDIASLFGQIQFLQHELAKDQMEVIKYADYSNQFTSWMSQQSLIQSIKSLIRVGRKGNLSGRNLNLIKFKINDLMRCQIRGDKKVIKKVYENLQQLQNDNELTILKVKNRLNQQMNDIMIFFEINDSFLVCECQLVLAMQSYEEEEKKTKNVQELNHFLYQLERSPFGVIGEAAVFLKTKSQSMSYCKQIKLSMQNNTKVEQCIQKHQEKHEIKVESNLSPFVCSKCLIYYPKFSNLASVQKCTICRFSFCNNCINYKQPIKEILIDKIKAQFAEKLKNCLQLKNKSAQQILGVQKMAHVNQRSWFKIFSLIFQLKFEYLKDKFGRGKQNNIKTQSIINHLKQQCFEYNSNKNIYFVIVIWRRECPLFKCFAYDFRSQKIYNCYQPLESYEKHELMTVSDYDVLLLFNQKRLKETKNTGMHQLVVQDILNRSLALFQDQNVSKMQAQLQKQTKQMFKNSNLIYISIKFDRNSKQSWSKRYDFQGQNSKYYFYIPVNYQGSIESVADGSLKAYLESNHTTTRSRKNINLKLLNLKDKSTLCFLDKKWLLPNEILILNLRGNQMSDLSPILQACKNLQQIDASRNKLTKIKFLQNNASLISMNFSSNQINQICGFSALTNVEEIHFGNNKLGEQFEEEAYCQNIQNQNIFSKLSAMFFCFSIDKQEQLEILLQKQKKAGENKKIDQNYQSQQAIENNFKLPYPSKSALQKKQLGSQEQQQKNNKFPISLFWFASRQCPQLQTLNLSGNRLSEMKQFAAGQYPQLQTLDLSQNKISEIQQFAAGQFPQLQTLDLSRNNLSEIKQFASGQYPQLQTLNLSWNKLSQIKQFASGQFPQLQTLDLSDNQISEIKQFASGQFPQLQTLDLYNNKLSQIKQFASGQFPQLQTLNLYNNKLSEIKQFASGQFPQLQTLILSYNELEAMPKLQAAGQLKILKLRNNKLTSLPDISNLPEIKLLDLEYNPIQNIDILDVVSSRYEQLKLLTIKPSSNNRAKNLDLKERIQKKLQSVKVQLTDDYGIIID